MTSARHESNSILRKPLPPINENVKKPTVDPDITSLRRFLRNLFAISGFPFHGISLDKTTWSSKIRVNHLCARRAHLWCAHLRNSKQTHLYCHKESATTLRITNTVDTEESISLEQKASTDQTSFAIRILYWAINRLNNESHADINRMIQRSQFHLCPP